jgi:hypothetical protein
LLKDVTAFLGAAIHCPVQNSIPAPGFSPDTVEATAFKNYFNININFNFDRLCGLVVRFPGYRFRGPGSILIATIFSEK